MSQELDEIREDRNDKVAGIFKYFSLVMGVFYMAMGIIFYYFPLLENMDSWAKIGVSSLLFLYGIFRFWRALKS
jgi:hypothetical protein